jgi:hypothetical protein
MHVNRKGIRQNWGKYLGLRKGSNSSLFLLFVFLYLYYVIHSTLFHIFLSLYVSLFLIWVTDKPTTRLTYNILTAVKMSMFIWVVTPCGPLGPVDTNVSEEHTASIFSPVFPSLCDKPSLTPRLLWFHLYPLSALLNLCGRLEGGHGWLASSCDAGDKARNTVASASAESIHHHYCNETYRCSKPCILHILMSRNPKNDPVVYSEQRDLIYSLTHNVYQMITRFWETVPKVK